MPGPLKNERHERMAQELAKGTPQFEAYRAAGFGGGKQTASEIAAREDVRARVAELLERAARRAEISVASITERLVAIADKAEKDSHGTSGLSVARAALMDAAKLNGLVIDRTQRELSDEQLKIILDAVAANPGMAQQLLAQLS